MSQTAEMCFLRVVAGYKMMIINVKKTLENNCKEKTSVQ